MLASDFQVLRLKVCAIMLGRSQLFNKNVVIHNVLCVYSTKDQKGAGKSSVVKCSLCKLEDLSSIPSTHGRKNILVIPLGKWRQEDA